MLEFSIVSISAFVSVLNELTKTIANNCFKKSVNRYIPIFSLVYGVALAICGFYIPDTYFGNKEDIYSWITECGKRAQELETTTLFEQPYITWGGTVSAVKSFMSGYELYGDDTTEEGEYILIYEGKYKESEIDYWFTSKTGGLHDGYSHCPGGQSQLRQNDPVQCSDRLQPVRGKLARRDGGKKGGQAPEA